MFQVPPTGNPSLTPGPSEVLGMTAPFGLSLLHLTISLPLLSTLLISLLLMRSQTIQMQIGWSITSTLMPYTLCFTRHAFLRTLPPHPILVCHMLMRHMPGLGKRMMGKDPSIISLSLLELLHHRSFQTSSHRRTFQNLSSRMPKLKTQFMPSGIISVGNQGGIRRGCPIDQSS